MSDKDNRAISAGAGAAAGTATGISLVAADIGAAATTAGLATTGTIAIVAAAPIAVGMAVYGLYKWLKD